MRTPSGPAPGSASPVAAYLVAGVGAGANAGEAVGPGVGCAGLALPQPTRTRANARRGIMVSSRGWAEVR